jgi:hypothetical protein
MLRNDAIPREVLDRVLTQKGFGNPNGRYWFIGVEEGGGGTIDELIVRGTQYQPIDDLHHVNEIDGCPSVDLSSHITPTWIIMSKIVRCISGEPDWRDRAAALAYQATRLGRANGDTFLAEVLPLPVPTRDKWPYPTLWPTREEYEDEVIGMRCELLRVLFDEYRPRLVVCYGKRDWLRHQAIFNDVAFTAFSDGKMRRGSVGASTIVLTPFFHYWLMTNDRICALAAELR